MNSIRLKAAALSVAALSAATSVTAAPKIYVNEFVRAGNLTTTDEWIEVVLAETLTAAQLEGFYIGDSTGTTVAKFSGYKLTNMAAIASSFPAGTIIVVAGTTGPAADATYNPAGGDWNLVFKTNGSNITGNGSSGDLGGTDVAYVDTNGTNGNATISADGFAVNWHATPGAFGAAASVTVGVPTNNTGVALGSALAAATTAASWQISVPLVSTTPGVPNGGGNTTDVNALRAGLVAPVPTLSIANASVAEGTACAAPGTSNLAFTVTASGTSAQPITFNVATADVVAANAATANVDYVAPVALTGTIVAGQTTTTVNVSVNCDATIEADEIFNVVISNPQNATIATGTATGTITNDDVVAAARTLTIGDLTVTENDVGGVTADFIITLSSPAPAGGITYDIGIASGTAVKGDDYDDTSGDNLVIAEGQSTATFPVSIIADDLGEAQEQFVVNVSNVTPAAEIDFAGSDFQAIGTIENDDGPISTTLSIDDITAVEGDSGTTNARFTVYLNQAAGPGGVTYSIATSDGTAVAPGDYIASSTNGTIPEGALSAFFDVPVVGDTTDETNETFSATVTNVGGAFAIDTNATATIADDDTQATATTADVSTTEGDTGAKLLAFTITIDAAQSSNVVFSASTVDGTAVAGSDFFGLLNAPVTILAGQTSATLNVTVRGDLAPEANETFSVVFTTADPRVTVGDGTAVATLTNDDTLSTIAQIQGNGFNAALSGAGRLTNGVVTALLPNGFFMQMQAPDGVLETSDAMFVYTAANPASTPYFLVRGDLVRVKGEVNDAAVAGLGSAPNYSGLTKFIATGLVIEKTGSAALPTPFAFDTAIPSPNPAAPTCGAAPWTAADTTETRNYECLEGMRVTVLNGLITGPSQAFAGDPIGEAWASVNAGPVFREIGLTYDLRTSVPPTLTPPAPAVPAAPIFDGNPQLFEIDTDRQGGANPPLFRDATFSATGVLGFEFGDFELFPDPNGFTLTSSPTLPIATVRAAANDEVSIGTFNVLRLFNDVNDAGTYDDCATPGLTDVCPTTATFQENLARRAEYIDLRMGAPFVVALQEVENTATLQALAAALNARNAAYGYTAHMGTDQNNDFGHINTGFLVRSGVTVDSITQFGVSSTWSFNGASQGVCDDTNSAGCLHNRPPVLLRGTATVGTDVLPIAVLAVHLKSFDETDRNTVAGHRDRQKRLRGARQVAQFVQDFQQANPVTPLVVLGDFNAYEFTDGLVDIVGIIRGDANRTTAEYPLDFDDLDAGTGPDGNVVVPALYEAALSLPATERWSYTFAGSSQLIDHILLGDRAKSRLSGVGIVHLNAATPVSQRVSDHDGLVVFLEAGEVLFSDSFE